MDRADTNLVYDIGAAAFQEAMRSIVIKVDILPIPLRPPALAVALKLIGMKSAALAQACPELAAILAADVAEQVTKDADALRQMQAAGL